MPIATNDKGDTVFLDSDGAWKPATLAEHPQTKQRLAFDGSTWTPLPSKISTGEAVGRGITQAASFGFRDEGQGLIEAGGGTPGDTSTDALTNLGYLTRGAYRKLTGDPEAEKRYQAAVERERASTKQIERERPGAYLGGQVAGAVAVPIGGALRAPTLAGRAGRGAALGAGTGALTGFGEGEGLGGSLTGAAIGAPLGAAVGAAAVPAVEGLVRGAGALVSKPASIIAGNLNPERAAQRAVGRAAMEAERSDPAALQRFTQGQLPGQPEGIVADVLGEGGRRLARSAGNISSEAAETLNATINPRLEGQAGRITRWIDDTLAFPNAHAQQQALEATQRTANSAAYRRAYEQGAGGIWTPELERLASSQGVGNAMRTAVQTSQDEAVRRGAGGFNPKISFTPDGRIQFNRGPTGVPTYPDLRYWDQVRRELTDAAQKAGRGTEENMRLGGLANALNRELDRAVPAYQVARRTAAGFFGAENALEAGQVFATQKFGHTEARSAVARMNDTERALFRDGYASRLKEVIAAQGDRRDLVKKIAATPAEREKMEIALGRQRANELIAMMHAESIMQKLIPAVQGNSTTAMQLITSGAAGAGAGGYLGYDPTTSGITTALMAALKGRGDRAVAQHVARLLTSRDPQVLARGMAALARNNRNMAILAKIDEALTRIGTQQAVQNIPGRQYGGPVEEDRPYLVGEAGPETFVPDDPWARAAARTGRRGRREGAGTRFVEGGYGIPAAYRALDKGAQEAFESAGKLQHYGDAYYDPAPVVQQAIGAAGAPLVAPAQAGAVLGAGAIRRAAIPQVAKQSPEMEAYLALKPGSQEWRQARHPEAKYPQYAEQYPPTAPPEWNVQTDPKKLAKGNTGWWGKVQSPEAKEFLKDRQKIMKEMDEKGYDPYFDPEKRFDVDPKNYPLNIDTVRIVPKTLDTLSKHFNNIGSVETRKALQDAYSKGVELGKPGIPGGRLTTQDWYMMGQLEQDLVRQMGEKAGREAFKEKFATAMAATTGGMDPRSNLIASGYHNYLAAKGQQWPTEANLWPSPVGARYGEQLAKSAQRIQDEGGFAALGEQNPKRHNFAGDFMGHTKPGTMDEQLTQLMQPGKTQPDWYGLNEHVMAQEAAKRGVDPRKFQETGWAGFKGEANGPMIQEVSHTVERIHRLTGMPREEIVRRIWGTGDIPVYSGAVPVPGGSFKDE